MKKGYLNSTYHHLLSFEIEGNWFNLEFYVDEMLNIKVPRFISTGKKQVVPFKGKEDKTAKFFSRDINKTFKDELEYVKKFGNSK